MEIHGKDGDIGTTMGLTLGAELGFIFGAMLETTPWDPHALQVLCSRPLLALRSRVLLALRSRVLFALVSLLLPQGLLHLLFVSNLDLIRSRLEASY